MKTPSWLQHRRYKVAAIAGACVLLACALLAQITLTQYPSRNPQERTKLHNLFHNYLKDLEYSRANYRLHDDRPWGSKSGSGLIAGYPSPSTRVLSTSDHDRSYFHLVVPATSSNHNLCKMLLSITALGYPAPVFINWGDEEKEDEYEQHLAKVGGILRHLKTLPADRPDDLVLIVDGYDAWFQLRPDVLLLRYYEVIQEENRRFIERYGSWRDFADRKEGFYQSIVFGPDKICWPEDPRRTACWAVPESPLPEYAFGPDTDGRRYRELNRPRWLNSGTIMGPVGDLVALFNATLNRIETANSTIISDQFHMANIFGEQEYARSVLFGELPDMDQTAWISDGMIGQGHFENITLDEPDLDLSVRRGTHKDYEYHITIDYESKMFQTNAYYWKTLSWISYDNTGREGSLGISKDVNRTNSFTMHSQDLEHLKLAEDITSSPAPFASIGDMSREPALQGDDPSRDPQSVAQAIPIGSTWKDFNLGTNLITGHVFPVMHFTPPKHGLETWWNKMWYYPYGEAIIKNAQPLGKEPIVRTPDGKEWWTWVTDDIDDVMPEDRSGGGFDDRGAWHSWHRLCKEHEKTVFLNERKTVYLPPQDTEDNPPP